MPSLLRNLIMCKKNSRHKGKRRRRRIRRLRPARILTGAEDLGEPHPLSNLPDDLLSLIISYIPTKEAVCTSILSRRWRNQWKHISRLDLNLQPSEITKSKVFYVNNMLKKLKHRWIKTCRISHYCYKADERLIYTLQYLLKYMGVEELSLNYDLRETKIESNLARLEGFFDCARLRNFELQNYSIKNERPFKGCVNLETLKLCSVWINENTLGNVISVCFSLKNLFMEDCVGFTTFKIDDSRNLKRLEIKGSLLSSDVGNFNVQAEGLEFLSIKSLENFSWHNCVIKCPSLKTLKLNSEPICFRFPIPYLQHIRIYGPIDRSVFRDGTCLFPNLTILHTTMDLNRMWPNLILRSLFRKCTKLQEVDIVNKADNDEPCDDAIRFEDSFWKTDYHDSIFYHLRLFRISGFKGRVREMRLVDYVITSASKLEKLFIHFDNVCPQRVISKPQEKIKLEILSMSRTSLDVSIIFD